jgi:flagellar hook-associated protein 3 FlgL
MKIATNTAIDNILDNYSRLLRVQNQMSTGRRVLDPSDDPLATNEGIRVQSIISELGQYKRNINVGTSFLEQSDGALQDVNNVETAARGMTIGMASDTMTPEMRRANVKEVGSLLQELVALGNRQVGNRFIFGGTRTTEAPLEVVGANYVHYTGNDDDITLQVDRESFVPSNIKATDVFGSLVTTVQSDETQPLVNTVPDQSTRLEDLNAGQGVAEGSVAIEYFDGVDLVYSEVDLQSADTLEDVVDLVEQRTNGDIDVEINAAHTGINLINTTGPANSIQVSEVASNTTARDLGIRGSSLVGSNTINGADITPQLNEETLLADVPGYYGDPLTLVTGSDNLKDPRFLEKQDINSNLAEYRLDGLTEGVTTDENGDVYFSVTDLGGNDYQVEVFKDDARLPTDRIAVGQINTAAGQGDVPLSAVNGSGVSGSVRLTYTADDDDIEVEVQFPDDFRSTIHVETFSEENDNLDQLSGWRLSGLQKGQDTAADGSLAPELSLDPADGPTVEVYRDRVAAVPELVASGSVTYQGARDAQDDANQLDNWNLNNVHWTNDTTDGQMVGEVVNVAGQWTVRLYSDVVGGDLVAEGALPAGEDTGTVTLVPQGAHTAGGSVDVTSAQADGQFLVTPNPTVQLTGAVGHEHVNGQVDVAYEADDNDINLTATFATVEDFMRAVEESDTYTTAEISEDGSALEIKSRLAGATLHVVQDGPVMHERDEDNQLSRWNLTGLQAGVNSDINGEIYGSYVEDPPASGNYRIDLYKDADRTEQVATASFSGPMPVGPVNFNESNDSGIFGTVYVDDYTADDTDFTLEPQGLGLSGKKREDNIFSTLVDVIEAGTANDTGALSELIGNFDVDERRVLDGRAEIGATLQRFEMLTSRLSDEETTFTKIFSQQIDLDYADAIVSFQEQSNVFNAALSVAGRIIPMSLVDFI